MPGPGEILDRILLRSDPRQSGIVERSAVRAAETAAFGRRHTGETEIGKLRQCVAKDRCRFRRAENAEPAGPAGSAVDIEISAEFRIVGCRLFK